MGSSPTPREPTPPVRPSSGPEEIGRVWMYWEHASTTSTRAPYLELCLETVKAHLDGLPLEVVDERTIFDWLPDLDGELWRRLPRPVSRSDYGRTRLVHRYGGIYLDFDCIVVDSLRRLAEPLRTETFAGWGADTDGRFFNNLFVSRAGSPFLAEWMELQDRALYGIEDWSLLPYALLGRDVGMSIAERVAHHNYPREEVAPILWNQWRRFFSRTASPAAVLARQPVTVMLWNATMGRPLRDISAEELDKGTTLLSRLLRIATGRSTVAQESKVLTRIHLLSDARSSAAVRKVRRRVLKHRREGYRQEVIHRKLRRGERLLEQGMDLPTVLERINTTQGTWDYWRTRYGAKPPEPGPAPSGDR